MKKSSIIMQNSTVDSKDSKNLRMQSEQKKSKIIFAVLGFALFCVILFFGVWLNSFYHPEKIRALSENEKIEIRKILNQNFPERNSILVPLFYNAPPCNFTLGAESAILVDFRSGAILYEKNADKIIPPASMTKLFTMYVVFDLIEQKKISLDDVVPLVRESWWKNLPSDASKMFLAEGQMVTLRELLQGLSIASGNDAAIAIAYYVSGGIPEFVQKMNQVAKSLGLSKTHFVEPSGYDEKNLTTAREFAAFCRIYVARFPFALSDFHSLKDFSYPLKKNLPEWQSEDFNPIYQKNTNPLLGKFSGCDGIKTGFIYESGYNLALTAEREGQRFLAVTMGGPGEGSAEGNKWRVHDGSALLDWAFSNFFSCDFDFSDFNEKSICVFGTNEKFCKIFPAFNRTLCLPRNFSEKINGEKISVKANFPKSIFGPIKIGQILGEIVIANDKTIFQKIPLVADRTLLPANVFSQVFAHIAQFFFEKKFKEF